VRLHPNLAGVYRQKVAALEQALANPLDKAEAMEIVRSQIDRITLTPGENGELDVALQGDLACIMQLCEAGPGKNKRPRTDVPGRELSVVAGAGFEPATFRYEPEGLNVVVVSYSPRSPLVIPRHQPEARGRECVLPLSRQRSHVAAAPQLPTGSPAEAQAAGRACGRCHAGKG
jgi:hypothetical protein